MFVSSVSMSTSAFSAFLSIDFIREIPHSPKQKAYQETIMDSYPHVKELSVRGSENPNLMPRDAVTIRFHSVGGWGAITTGKNLAMTLYELLGYNIKANPKYGSEKKGQPTTYYLAASSEPIRINCEYFFLCSINGLVWCFCFITVTDDLV